MGQILRGVDEDDLTSVMAACLRHGWLNDPGDLAVEGHLMALEVGILTGIRLGQKQ